MEIKIRPVHVKGKITWYDYKMAVIGTLTDYNLYVRPHGSRMMIYKIDDHEPFRWDAKNLVYMEKRTTWMDFYENKLWKVIKKELV